MFCACRRYVLNLLANLKSGRYFKSSAKYCGLVFVSFVIGAALFYFYGTAAYSCFESNFSNSLFSVAYIVLFALLILSAFSQFGLISVAAVDIAFGFLALLFAFESTLGFSGGARIKSAIALGLQEFILIFLSMLFSQRAAVISTELLRRTTNDRKFFGALSANLFLFLAFFALLIFICITAF